MTITAKSAGAVAGSLVLLSSGLLAGVPTVMHITAEAATPAAAEEAVATEVDRAAVPVEGTFTYDQAVVTSNADIASVFAKAAATLCQNGAEQGESFLAQAIKITCAAGNSFNATVAEMTDEEVADSYIMGCSCATNMAGGGAIANAEVSGVSLASVAAMAQAA